MNLYEQIGQSEEGSGEPIAMTYEEYLERKEVFEAQLEVTKAAHRLAENPDFQLVVMDHYFVKEPQRLAELMASGRLNQKSFENSSALLKSIGDFRSFLREQVERGNLAMNELESLENAYQEAVASGAFGVGQMI